MFISEVRKCSRKKMIYSLLSIARVYLEISVLGGGSSGEGIDWEGGRQNITRCTN